MDTEDAYRQLTGQWRVLIRKCESVKSAKSKTLSCIALHNVCIALGDTLPRNLDLSADHATNFMRPQVEVRQMLKDPLLTGSLCVCLQLYLQNYDDVVSLLNY